MSTKPTLQGSVVLLWAGENPALHSALLEQLQAAEIPFSDKTLGDDEVAPTADPLPIDWKPRFGFEVAVLSTDIPAAKEILEKLLEEEPADLEIPARDEATAEEPALVVTGMGRPVAGNSGMVVIAQRGGTVTRATAAVIEVDNDDV